MIDTPPPPGGANTSLASRICIPDIRGMHRLWQTVFNGGEVRLFVSAIAGDAGWFKKSPVVLKSTLQIT